MADLAAFYRNLLHFLKPTFISYTGCHKIMVKYTRALLAGQQPLYFIAVIANRMLQKDTIVYAND